MFRTFNDAKAESMKRMENPRLVPLAWYREAWEGSSVCSARPHGSTA
jgi:hypothetical protein